MIEEICMKIYLRVVCTRSPLDYVMALAFNVVCTARERRARKQSLSLPQRGETKSIQQTVWMDKCSQGLGRE